MKKLLLILTLGTSVLTNVAQSPNEEVQKKALLQRAAEQQQAGNLEGAIDAASKLLELELKSPNRTSFSHRQALINLARLSRDNFLALRTKAGKKGLNIRDRIDISNKATSFAEKAEKFYREAIELPKTQGVSENGVVSEAMGELAWLTHNYLPADDDVPTIAESRSRIDRAESLYTEALKLSEESYGEKADKTMLIVLSFGNFYQKYDNYEKSSPLYERYLETVERVKGEKNSDLVNALRPYAQILYATFREGESTLAIKRIEEITGRGEDLPLGKLGLHLRSKDSVAFHARAIEKTQNIAKATEGSSVRRPRFVSVPVRVTVDENGKITESIAETSDSGLKKRAEQEVSKWFVRPFSYNGTKQKLRGYLSYRETY